MIDKYLSDKTSQVIQDVMERRLTAIQKYGSGADYPPGQWLTILMEEVGEICQALQADEPWSKETDKGNDYEEIIDAIVVLFRWAETFRDKS